MTDTSTKAVEALAKNLAGVEYSLEDHGLTKKADIARTSRDTLRALLTERDDLQARREEFEADNIRLGRTLGEMQGHTFFCQDAEGVLRRWYPPAAVPMFQPGEVVASPATAAKGERS